MAITDAASDPTADAAPAHLTAADGAAPLDADTEALTAFLPIERAERRRVFTSLLRSIVTGSS